MADADWIARGLAIASLGVAAFACWLNWRKDQREIAQSQPRHSTHFKRVGPRTWAATMVVTNPTETPIVWVRVDPAVKGLKLATAASGMPEIPTTITTVFHRNVYAGENGPIQIEAGGKAEWSGFVYRDDEFPARVGFAPKLQPLIDGYFKRRLLDRITRWIFNKPITM